MFGREGRQAKASQPAEGEPAVGLFDRSPSVRDLAQRFLRAQGIDVRQRYIDALPDRAVALQGLAEVGTVQDAPIIEPYLDDQRVRARVVAVYAIGRLLGSKSRTVMLSKLDDPSPSVVRAAGRVMAREQLDMKTLDEVWQRSVAADGGPITRAAFLVFGQQGRWPRLVIACRALAAADEDVRRRGRALLDSVLASWNNSATEPTAAYLAEVQALEPTVIGRLPTRAGTELHGLIQQYGSGDG